MDSSGVGDSVGVSVGGGLGVGLRKGVTVGMGVKVLKVCDGVGGVVPGVRVDVHASATINKARIKSAYVERSVIVCCAVLLLHLQSI
jgi:hypothetical protein